MVAGGNGSLEAARRLAAEGIAVAFVPATIDNDVAGTERSLGFDSALAYAIGVIEQLRITGRSVPERGFLIQTLGGGTPQLAEAVAAAAGIADAIVPGAPLALEPIARRFAAHVADGEALAVIAEGTADPFELAGRLGALSGLRVHPTILGHAQRAAPPTDLDRRLGRLAGRAAVAALAEGRSVYVTLSAAGEPAPSGAVALARAGLVAAGDLGCIQRGVRARQQRPRSSRCRPTARRPPSM